MGVIVFPPLPPPVMVLVLWEGQTPSSLEKDPPFLVGDIVPFTLLMTTCPSPTRKAGVE